MFAAMHDLHLPVNLAHDGHVRLSIFTSSKTSPP